MTKPGLPDGKYISGELPSRWKIDLGLSEEEILFKGMSILLVSQAIRPSFRENFSTGVPGPAELLQMDYRCVWNTDPLNSWGQPCRSWGPPGLWLSYLQLWAAASMCPREWCTRYHFLCAPGRGKGWGAWFQLVAAESGTALGSWLAPVVCRYAKLQLHQDSKAFLGHLTEQIKNGFWEGVGGINMPLLIKSWYSGMKGGALPEMGKINWWKIMKPDLVTGC